MYQHFYGLRELPFELTPNPKYLFLTRQHREALSTLIYGLASAKGVTALIGEAGTGKTTLLHAALRSEQCRNVSCVYLMNPTLTREEFVEMLSVRFELSSHAARSKAAMLNELESRPPRAPGARTDYRPLVDEAQSLSGELLEEIRLLANSETDDREAAAAGTGRPAGTEGSAERDRAAAAETARHAALRDYAVHSAGNRRVHRVAHPHCGRRRRQAVHPRSRHADSRAFGRHRPHHQRHVRQRPADRIRHGASSRSTSTW